MDKWYQLFIEYPSGATLLAVTRYDELKKALNKGKKFAEETGLRVSIIKCTPEIGHVFEARPVSIQTS